MSALMKPLPLPGPAGEPAEAAVVTSGWVLTAASATSAALARPAPVAAALAAQRAADSAASAGSFGGAAGGFAALQRAGRPVTGDPAPVAFLPAGLPDPATRGLLDLARGRHAGGLARLQAARQASLAQGRSADANGIDRDLAAACLRLRRLPEALACQRRLIDQWQGRADVPALPWLWLQRGQALAALGQAAAADAALAWAQHLWPQGRRSTGWVAAELARLELALCAPPAAGDAARLAAHARGLAGQLTGSARGQALRLQARAHRLAGAPAEALALLPLLCGQQTLATDPALHALAWAEAGLAHLAEHDWRAAGVALGQAIIRFDDLRTALPGALDDSAPATADALQEACTARLDLALRTESPEQALLWLHRLQLRAQGQTSVRTGSALHAAAAPPQLARLQLQRATLQRALQRQLEDGAATASSPHAGKLQWLTQALMDAARRQRRSRWGSGMALIDGDDALDTPRLLAHFQDGRALVSFGVHQGRVLAMLVAGGRCTAQRLPLRPAELAAAADAPAGDASARDAPAADTAAAPALHQQLWAALEPVLAGTTSLTLVPGPLLAGMPAAALRASVQQQQPARRLHLAASLALAPSAAAGTDA